MMQKCSILADPESGAWEFAEKVYSILSKRDADFSLNKVNIVRFRDGEIKPRVEQNIRQHKCFFIHDSSKPATQWLTEIALINETMRNSSACEVTDIIPYLRFARQDRKDETRVSISAKVVSDIIELYADRALSIDIHNPALQGFYGIPFDNLYSFSYVLSYLKAKFPEVLKDIVVMSPDAGGAERAEAFAKKLKLQDIAVGYKHREKAGEVKTMKVLGDVQGKNVMIVDDIIDSGNTLIKACTMLKEVGAKKVYAYATHGIFSLGTSRLAECFDAIFVGDTIPGQNADVNVIPFAPLIAEAIYRIHKGESLSELFDTDFSF